MTRVLITSARFSSALSMIRKFGQMKHTVFASDTFRTSPGLHSKHIRESGGRAILTRQPREEQMEFFAGLRDTVNQHEIEWIVPSFEEYFYMNCNAPGGGDSLGTIDANVFAPKFETAAMLHNKIKFLDLCQEELGLPIPPRTIIVQNESELKTSIHQEFRGKLYLARPAYSRGSVHILTNASGKIRSSLPISACHPTPTNPWLIQDYCEEAAEHVICTCSIVHHGTVVAHATYAHSMETDSVGAMVIQSIEEGGTLQATRKVCEYCNYHGILSLDFCRVSAGRSNNSGELRVIECNPRPTIGISFMPDDIFVNAVLHGSNADFVHLAPAGVRRKYTEWLVLDMASHVSHISQDMREITSSRAMDIYAEWGDVMPALYQVLSYGRHFWYGQKNGLSLAGAYVNDVSWDGTSTD